MNQQPTQALKVLISIISSGIGFKKEVEDVPFVVAGW